MRFEHYLILLVPVTTSAPCMPLGGHRGRCSAYCPSYICEPLNRSFFVPSLCLSLSTDPCGFVMEEVRHLSEVAGRSVDRILVLVLG
jgi:hypothetical protein